MLERIREPVCQRTKSSHNANQSSRCGGKPAGCRRGGPHGDGEVPRGAVRRSRLRVGPTRESGGNATEPLALWAAGIPARSARTDTPGIVRFRYHGRAIIPWIIGSLSCFDYPSDPTYTQTAALTPTQTCRAIWKARLCHTRKPSNAKP
ncbi:Hypothetical protein RY70_410 [Bifidobacterium bifidum]|nr:Hypothetical protein RY70_410 [Bifidobacterium bifidum]